MPCRLSSFRFTGRHRAPLLSLLATVCLTWPYSGGVLAQYGAEGERAEAAPRADAAEARESKSDKRDGGTSDNVAARTPSSAEKRSPSRFRVAPLTELERQLDTALPKKIDVEFVDVPLKDSLESLREQTNLPFRLDEAALAERGISADAPVHLVAKQIALEDALYWILEPYGLAWAASHGMVVVSTRLALAEMDEIHVYDLSALNIKDQLRFLDVIQTTSPVKYWMTIDGTGAEAEMAGNVLILRASLLDHRAFQDYLEQLGRVVNQLSFEEPPAREAPAAGTSASTTHYTR